MSVDHSHDPDPIEELLLTAYPNPERKGCPGREVLESLANQQRDESDPNWYHIWHCSPCFAEFKALRDARWERERAEARRRKHVLWIGAAAAPRHRGVSRRVVHQCAPKSDSRSDCCSDTRFCQIWMRLEVRINSEPFTSLRFLARSTMCG